MELDNDQKLAINSNDSDALKLLPQDLRYQHADKILKNLL